MVVWVLVSAVTNLALLPATYMLWIRSRPIAFVVGLFTAVSSFMYHFCESIEAVGSHTHVAHAPDTHTRRTHATHATHVTHVTHAINTRPGPAPGRRCSG